MVGYGFLPVTGPDRHVIRFQADIGAARGSTVTGCSPVGIPDPHVCAVTAGIVPVPEQEVMAGQQG